MFDTDMHKEYLFLSYLIGLLPEEKEEPIDLEGKLKLEYYKLQKTFEGAIKLEKLMGSMFHLKSRGHRESDRKAHWMKSWIRLTRSIKGSSQMEIG